MKTISLNKTPLTPLQRIKMLWALRSHQAASDAIRDQLGIHRPGELIARYEDADDRALVVTATGLGGATVETVEGNYPVDYLTHFRRDFATETEALEFAEKLQDGFGEADEG